MSDRRAMNRSGGVHYAMHEMHDCDIHGGGECGQHGICRWCNAPWPCATIRALDADGDVRDPYLDALEQLDQMRDRAFEAEAAIQRVRDMADAAIAAHGELEGTYATVSAKAILRALGDSDD